MKNKNTAVYWGAYLLASLAVVLLASLGTAYYLGQEAESKSEERLSLYTGTLLSALDKYRHLPVTVAEHPAVLEALSYPAHNGGANGYLQRVNSASDAAALYVLNRDGLTVASSNWHEPTSFVGNNYGFRSYFREAAAGNVGFLFAIGTTTGLPGLFISTPVYDGPIEDGGALVGVSVVKVDLDPLQEEWRKGGETVLVTDRNGVVILASNADWLYHALSPLPESVKAQIRANRQYDGQALDPLDYQSASGEFRHRVKLGGAPYLVSRRELPDHGWQIYYLADMAPVNKATWVAGLFTVALAVLALLTYLLRRERRLKVASEKRAHEAEAMREINAQLEREVATRREAEQELRATQNELIQAGKLAALGQMSASVVHEINQPLSAIRTFAYNAKRLLVDGETEAIAGNLDRISSLTERLASITGDLRTFSRKSKGERQPTELQSCVRHAVTLMEPQLRLAGVEIDLEMAEAPLVVLGDAVRIEQVLVNLIRNAMDAMENLEPEAPRQITVRLRRQGEAAELSVRDTGTGIAEELLTQVFDPFFTTKASSESLGLGLAITCNIVEDMGGRITGANRAQAGACFTVTIPLQKDQDVLQEKATAEVQ